MRVSTTVLAKVQAELREENESLRRQISVKENVRNSARINVCASLKETFQEMSRLREQQAKKDPRGSLRPGAPEHATIAELRAAKDELSGKIADLRERLEATAVLLSEAEAENERCAVCVCVCVIRNYMAASDAVYSVPGS